MKQTVISVMIRAPLGFLKKTDMNEYLYLTYNSLHKPALLGILGAIAGLGGFYQSYIEDPKQLPEYYRSLSGIGVGIKPVSGTESVVFKKSYLRYNNSTGFASYEEGGNLIVQEQILIDPAYKVYLKLDLEDETQKFLFQNLKESKAVYIPYLGKNEFNIWWEDFIEYSWSEFIPESGDIYQIDTLFKKMEDTKIEKKSGFKLGQFNPNTIFNFERLPSGYDTQRRVYTFDDYVLTNVKFDGAYYPGNLFRLNGGGFENLIIQLN